MMDCREWTGRWRRVLTFVVVVGAVSLGASAAAGMSGESLLLFLLLLVYCRGGGVW